MKGARRFAIGFVVAWGLTASAAEVAVPLGLQAELLAKVATYDRNFAARAGDKARILILTTTRDPESPHAAAQLSRALGALPSLGGIAHEESIEAYTTPTALAELVRSRKAAVVYLTPGFGELEAGAIARALDGIDVLSVSVSAELIPKGIVLGFDLVSGKSKLVVNLPQARAQHVDFRADVLKIMKVIE
jgi:hypothetical protein